MNKIAMFKLAFLEMAIIYENPLPYKRLIFHYLKFRILMGTIRVRPIELL
jgi:hypothetical protein